MTPDRKQGLRDLPAIGQLLERERVRKWLDRFPRAVVVDALQAGVDEVRRRLLGGDEASTEADAVLSLAERALEAGAAPSLRRVINATGVVLHTGLGRAPLCEEAVAAVAECARGYCNLEMELEGGRRGHRPDHVAGLLAELTGAEAATVVNNNAAATLLILNTVARGREVVVSRGQLVEIGGSYRLPEMMAASGAVLREVGTTNRTRPADYERAIGDETAALLHVHTSNYRVVGFCESVEIAELVELGRRHGKLVIDDLGSGALFNLAEIGLPGEPDARGSIAAGADLVCFSGDKLLGGPQAGIVLGRAELIRRIEANPLMRTYRVDKMTLAGLEATLRQYRDRGHAARVVPSLAMLGAGVEALRERAAALCALLSQRLPGESFEVVEDVSVAGGGSLPAREMPTACVAWRPSRRSAADAQAALRHADPPIIARTSQDRVLFDVRTIGGEDHEALAEGVRRIVS